MKVPNFKSYHNIEALVSSQVLLLQCIYEAVRNCYLDILCRVRKCYFDLVGKLEK